MKALISMVFALTLVSGCTFFTEIDANFNTGGEASGDKCDRIRILLEMETQEEARAELARAYARCLDGAVPRPSPPDPCQEGDDCEPRPPECPDGDDCEPRPPEPCQGDEDCWPEPEPPAPGPTCPGFDVDELDEWYLTCRQEHSVERCVYVAARCLGFEVDVDDVCAYLGNENAEGFIAVCLDHGFSELVCEDIVHHCSSQVPPPHLPFPDCEVVRDHVEQEYGLEFPLSEEEVNDIFEECLSHSNGQDCELLIQCLL